MNLGVRLRPPELRRQLGDVCRFLERYDFAVLEREHVRPAEVHEPAARFRGFATRPEHDHYVARCHELPGLELRHIEGGEQKTEKFTYCRNPLAQTTRREVWSARR